MSYPQMRIGDVVEPKVDQRGPNGAEMFTYVDISSIDNEAKRITAPKTLLTKSAPSRAKQNIRVGDVLVSMTRPNLNAVALTPEELSGAVASTGFDVLRAKDIEPKWLLFRVMSHDFIEEMCAKVQGALYPAVRPKDIRDHLLPVPDRDTQRRVVRKVEAMFADIDAGIQDLRQSQSKLDLYKQSVLNAAIRGLLVPQDPNDEPTSKLLERIRAEKDALTKAGKLKKEESLASIEPDEIPFELPKGWEWVRASQVCNFITKGTTPTKDQLVSDKPEIPFLKVYNLTFDGTIDFTIDPTFIPKAVHEEVLTRSKVFPGDVLMNIVGPPMGKVGIVSAEHAEWNINQAIAVFRPLGGISSRYLSMCLLSPLVLGPTLRKGKTTAGQFNLTLELCRDILIPVPPIGEQQRIVMKYDGMRGDQRDTHASLASSEDQCRILRQAVLKSAFEGKLV